MMAPQSSKAPVSAPSAQPLAAAGSAMMLASLPMPAYAGGMFDFGLTLPFVAIAFLTMMAVLNALWYAPVTQDMEERNAKLLQTLSDATDNLAKADAMQVEYTEQIRATREKASAAVGEYRATVTKTIEARLASAKQEREQKADELKKQLDKEIMEKKAAAGD